MAYRLFPRTVCAIPLDAPIVDELIRSRVPMVRRTSPDPETFWTVTVARPDVHWRINGKRCVTWLAKGCLPFATGLAK